MKPPCLTRETGGLRGVLGLLNRVKSQKPKVLISIRSVLDKILLSIRTGKDLETKSLHLSQFVVCCVSPDGALRRIVRSLVRAEIVTV